MLIIDVINNYNIELYTKGKDTVLTKCPYGFYHDILDYKINGSDFCKCVKCNVCKKIATTEMMLQDGNVRRLKNREE